jgi:hypothetical protein
MQLVIDGFPAAQSMPPPSVALLPTMVSLDTVMPSPMPRYMPPPWTPVLAAMTLFVMAGEEEAPVSMPAP